MKLLCRIGSGDNQQPLFCLFYQFSIVSKGTPTPTCQLGSAGGNLSVVVSRTEQASPSCPHIFNHFEAFRFLEQKLLEFEFSNSPSIVANQSNQQRGMVRTYRKTMNTLSFWEEPDPFRICQCTVQSFSNAFCITPVVRPCKHVSLEAYVPKS